MLRTPAPASVRSAARSVARLWPWVRPIRGRLAAATVLAAVASVLALSMPLVLKWVADGPVAHRDPAGTWLGGGLLLALGVAEALIFGVRRRLVARPLAGVEAGMRQAFYRHVQRLPVAAHERWSSGQLLSRSTADLQLLHGFLAVALPFLVVNAVTLTVGCVILLAQQWVLFERVSFAYHPGTTVLPCLNLTIPAGQTVAVVGATGSGKSTLVKLVARLYDPVGGRIALDGADLRDLTTDDLRSTVVMLPQDAFLFTTTVADNIALGRPGVSRSDIEAATTAVGAHGFVTDLPDGYDTRLTGGSGHLSAGQRQLLALARVLIADPSVVILDEATSSLDIPTERLIHDAVRTILAGRTALIVAHRPSTIRIADRILVMSDGHVVEDLVRSHGPTVEDGPGEHDGTPAIT